MFEYRPVFRLSFMRQGRAGVFTGAAVKFFVFFLKRTWQVLAEEVTGKFLVIKVSEDCILPFRHKSCWLR